VGEQVKLTPTDLASLELAFLARIGPSASEMIYQRLSKT
jgi:hypothetical protein